MNRFVQIFLGAALAFNLANADLSVTHPVDEIWRAGTQNAITWTDTGSNPAPASFSISLMYGPQNRLEQVAAISASVPSNPPSYNWFIPGTTRPGSQYVIRFGEGENAKYSHYFTIDNPSLPAMTNYTNAPTTPKPTSAPSAGASSSNGSSGSDTNEKKNGAFRAGAGVVGFVGVVTSFLLM
ncbi:hypothetical protein K493DRAFT_319241 [Basidiobolus meristosporus CBS 931.73]|uniref:Yeast cell wall synthesis Kre9/Knh1-like N-terminal domain-containing protein n=1 Tax=Basidiobolus meristosporus CBS 931.73 TaxID=1314790 RepID=A0A1Y1XSJ7_9FUNG|nr:hypothetical protein K493DRAFT_319241 [Basidiobolus meristosporus CBS 931.73]|eukprot:ORX88732.1 hypothetical protein K493DRAFT_319241 [Basidiobolus meristosporus CBS 931.73]